MNDVGDVFDVINGGIYFLEGNYKDAAVSIAAAVPGLGTGATIAKAAATGLKAVGASEKVAAKVGCKIGSAIQAAPHAVVAALSYEQGKEQLKEGNYLGAMMSFVSMGSSLYRAKNVGTYCFTEGTQVVVGMEYDVDGNFVSYVTVNIEDVQVGDLVYSYDTATGEVSQKAVVSTSALRSDHINYLTIIDEDGNEQVIETTDTHPFWVVTDDPDLERAARSVVDENGVWLYHENVSPTEHGFWVEAKDLQIGDVFLGANGELSTLTNLVRVKQDGGIAVFNFTVEGNHNYFILAKEYEYGQTCVLVHNGNPCNQPRNEKGQFTSGAGGNTADTIQGNAAHNNYQNALGCGYKYNKQISKDIKLRPDAIDWVNRIVRELKPATASGIKQGIRQLNKYIKALEAFTGKKWKGFLDLYNP